MDLISLGGPPGADSCGWDGVFTTCQVSFLQNLTGLEHCIDRPYTEKMHVLIVVLLLKTLRKRLNVFVRSTMIYNEWQSSWLSTMYSQYNKFSGCFSVLWYAVPLRATQYSNFWRSVTPAKSGFPVNNFPVETIHGMYLTHSVDLYLVAHPT